MKKIFSLLLVLVTLLGVSALVSQESFVNTDQTFTETFDTLILPELVMQLLGLLRVLITEFGNIQMRGDESFNGKAILIRVGSLDYLYKWIITVKFSIQTRLLLE